MVDIILGAFFGDEGKGQCVNNLCDEPSVHQKTVVVRFSGANQVGHNVTCNGLNHCFRNFGSGTLKNVSTYWSEYCVCDLHTVLTEALELQSLGIKPKIIFSPFCELVTPFDVINQWNNSANRSHGTVGTGFKSVLDRVKNGYSLTILDAQNLLILREKVYNIGEHYYNMNSNMPMTNLNDWIFEVNKMANFFQIADISCLNKFDHIIFEGSQGILLDQKHGVMPFCTPSNTTSKNAMKIIHNLHISDNVRVNYVCRPYITRHGNGPLLTSTSILDIDDQNNQYNDFQKTFRSCEFDVDLLAHSIKIDSYYSVGSEHRVVFSHGNELTKKLYDKVKTTLPSKLGMYIDFASFEYENWL